MLVIRGREVAIIQHSSLGRDVANAFPLPQPDLFDLYLHVTRRTSLAVQTHPKAELLDPYSNSKQL